MGKVFLADDTQMDRLVAIKQVSKALLSSPTASARFQREAMVQAKIQNPYVLGIYDAALEAETPLLIMEYVEGTDFADILQRRGPLDLDDASRYLKEIAQGLDVLHQAGVLHRDIKPGNLMLRADSDTALVMDLGLAAVLDQTALTATGALLGTPAYLPPEVLGTIGWVKASDQHALAVSFAELLSGQRCFSGMPLEQMMMAVYEGVPASYLEGMDLPAEVQQVLRKATDPDPAQRYPSCTAFAEAFHAATLAEDVEASRSAMAREALQVEVPATSPDASGAFPPDVTGPHAPPPPAWRRPLAVLGVLGLFLAAALLPAGAEVRDLKYRVVGDVLEVDFAASGPTELRVEVGGQVLVRRSEPVGDRQRVVVRGLGTGATTLAIQYPGGRLAEVEVQPQGAALAAPPRLDDQGRLVVRFRRPVDVGWEGDELRRQAAGAARWPLPEEVRTLRWVEDGVASTRVVDPVALLDAVVQAAVEARLDHPRSEAHDLGVGDVEAWRQPFARVRASWKRIVAAGLPAGRLAAIWEGFEDLDRADLVRQAGWARGGTRTEVEPEPLWIPRRHQFFWDKRPGLGKEVLYPPPPGFRSGVRLDPEDGEVLQHPKDTEPGHIDMTVPTAKLYPGSAAKATRAHFTWPEVPADLGPTFVLWVQFVRGEFRSELRIEPEDPGTGVAFSVFPGVDVWLWRVAQWQAADPAERSPDPKGGFWRWVGLEVPRALAPRPGTRMLVTLRPQVRSQIRRIAVRQVGVGSVEE